MDQVDAKQVALKLQQAYNNHGVAAIAQLYSEDATYILSGEAEPMHGREPIDKTTPLSDAIIARASDIYADLYNNKLRGKN